MDARIRRFLADPENNRYPQYRQLIERIQDITLDHHADSHLRTLLDNLQWKLYYYQKTWEVWWRNAGRTGAAAGRVQHRASARAVPRGTAKPSEGNRSSIDELFALQQRKLREEGLDADLESKARFEERLRTNLKLIKEMRRSDQQVTLVYDKQQHRFYLGLE
jgi:hypothetical protein